jgi:DHA2 family multidrug resistance protein-like MFS transporter
MRSFVLFLCLLHPSITEAAPRTSNTDGAPLVSPTNRRHRGVHQAMLLSACTLEDRHHALVKKLTVFAVGFGLFNDVALLLMIVPILPTLAEAATGNAATDLQMALLFSIKDICQLIGAPIAGALTLRHGARKLLAASLAGMAAATVAFAEGRTFRALLFARACQGIASAELMSGGLSLIAQTHTASEDRTAAMALAHSGLGLGATLGPVLGGLLYGSLGRRATFYAAASLVLLNSLVVWRLPIPSHVAAVAVTAATSATAATAAAPPVPTSTRRSGRESATQQLLSLVSERDVAIVAAGVIAILAAGGLFDTIYGLQLSGTHGVGPARASVIFALEPLCYMLSLWLLAPLGRHTPKPVIASLGLGLVGLSLPVLVMGDRLVSVLAALIIHGIGYGFKDLVGNSLLADLVDRRAVGSYEMVFALADMADSIGYILGPICGVALCRALRSRALGLLVFGLGCVALMPMMLCVDG